MLDHAIAPGVQSDMTEHGWDRDDWPKVWEKGKSADILVIGTPLWLGEESSVCRVLIERLYGMSALLNDKGQSIYYGKVGGSVITGNEDGVKHAAMTICYALSHLAIQSRRRPIAAGSERRVRVRHMATKGRWKPRWLRQRVHRTQHHDHDVESDAIGAGAEDGRWLRQLRQ